VIEVWPVREMIKQFCLIILSNFEDLNQVKVNGINLEFYHFKRKAVPETAAGLQG